MDGTVPGIGRPKYLNINHTFYPGGRTQLLENVVAALPVSALLVSGTL
jgi:hypothetical protein